jgi:hypothetical protein
MLPSNERIQIAEPLPSNDKEEYTYRHTDRLEGFMKYSVETVSGAMIYIPSFRNTTSGIRTMS